MSDKAAQSRLIVGLTGGIGSGKTAATRIFQTLGIDVVDADLMARVVVEPGTPALQSIAEHFGEQILTPDGSLDRAALRQRVFANPTERQWLENLLHPVIREEIVQRLRKADSAYAILSSPLLLETGQHALTDRVLLIDAPEARQIERTCQRDGASPEGVAAIMATQWSRSQRQERADDVILNDGDLSQLEHKVRAMHQTYIALSTTPRQTE